MTASVPVYAVTGPPGSGKTALIKKLLINRRSREEHILAAQFESGEEELGAIHNCETLNFSGTPSDEAAAALAEHMKTSSAGEIWIEWDGLRPFSELLAFLSSPPLAQTCRVGKVISAVDCGSLGDADGCGPDEEYIENCDFAVLREAESKRDFRRAKRLLRGLNPGVGVFGIAQMSDIFGALYTKKRSPVGAFCKWLIVVTALLFAVSRFIDLSETPANTLINVYLSIIIQAVPFLLIGVLISTAIHVFVSDEAIERRFPKKLAPGMLVAVLLGFCLPVCDCASVPIFRSLVKKGVPVPVAVTFLTATPVINPVTMLSTYYAFSGSLRVVAVRVGLGIAVSLLIGLFFSAWPSKEEILSGSFDAREGACCRGGETHGPESAADKWKRYVRHSETEFFGIAKYLMIGAFVSALFQTAGTESMFLQSTPGYALSVFLMMALAFLLSLCSTSDAVIARSFASFFPMGAAMGFLVFGPMMDVKNFIMLSGGFSRKFVLRLLIATFVLCYLVVLAFAGTLLGG